MKIQFDFPEAAYALLLIAVIWWGWSSLRAHRARAAHLLMGIPTPMGWIARSSTLDRARLVALSVAWILGCLAWMQPVGVARPPSPHSSVGGQKIVEERWTELDSEGEVTSVKRKMHDVIILMDVSASMAVADTRLKQTRLEYAKEIVDELLSRLKDEQASLYVFTSQLTTLSPPTNDYLFVRLTLRHAAINEGDVAGTDFLEALENLRRRHFQPHQDKLRTLVILSDGGDTRLEAASGEVRERELGAIAGQLGGAEALHLRVFTIGLGTREGEEIPGLVFQGQPVRSSLDEGLLKRLSEEGRGRYYFANDYSAVAMVDDMLQIASQDDPYVDQEEVERVRGHLERKVEKEQDQEWATHPYFQWPLSLALLGLAAYLWLPRCGRVE